MGIPHELDIYEKTMVWFFISAFLIIPIRLVSYVLGKINHNNYNYYFENSKMYFYYMWYIIFIIAIPLTLKLSKWNAKKEQERRYGKQLEKDDKIFVEIENKRYEVKH